MSECLFCNIVNKTIPADIIFEDENTLVFKDIAAQAPTHLLAIPKQHVSNLCHCENEALNAIFSTIKHISSDLKLEEDGFRVVTNIGENGGQTVPHLHFHILAGRPLTWPPG